MLLCSGFSMILAAAAAAAVFTIAILLCPQELRKASGQQLREVQMTQGEAVKQLRDERQQAEKKEAQLKVSSSSSSSSKYCLTLLSGVLCTLRFLHINMPEASRLLARSAACWPPHCCLQYNTAICQEGCLWSSDNSRCYGCCRWWCRLTMSSWRPALQLPTAR
jgi:hypothetical protein